MHDLDRPSQRAHATRRGFLARMSGLGLAALAGLPPPLALASREGSAEEDDDGSPATRRRRAAYDVRHEAALRLLRRPLTSHPDNGDERRYPSRIGSYSKCLPHDARGEVAEAAYGAFLHALGSGRGTDFEAIPMGGTLKLANPQAAFTFDLEGYDSHELVLAPPPAFSSAREAAEMAEVYWQALTRDVPFADFDADPSIAEAAADLSAFSDLGGPREGTVVTPATLFRGDTEGDLTGPYLSQMLWRDVPYGGVTVAQRYRTTVPGEDYMTSLADCLARQRGAPPATGNPFDSTPRYIRSGRDLAEWVHRDFTYEGFLNATLVLLALGPGALDSGNPYLVSATQGSFVTFGAPHVLDLMARVANAALRACWYQKWLVHRRLRPEAFGLRVHEHLTGAARYPIHADLLGAAVLPSVFSAQGTYLLPMAYPEGCPAHPSFPAGHAAIAGACATVLKAFFKDSFVMPAPVVASADGLSLLPYVGPDLTLGGELNKLAANIALGRDTAGVHWRSDGIAGLALGEAVSIGVLCDLRTTLTETFGGFSLTRFDGTTVVI